MSSTEPIRGSQIPHSTEPVKEQSKRKGIPVTLPEEHQTSGKVEPERFKKAPKQSEVKEKATEILGTKEWSIDKLLKAPDEIRNMVLKELSTRDLNALEIALSKGTKVEAPLQPALQKLHKQIKDELNNAILKEILKDNPAWIDAVSKWGGISLEDKIWLLRLHELRKLGVDIPIDTVPSQSSLDLLKKKQEITQNLAKVTELKLTQCKLKKCPNAICLLVNLETLSLGHNKLTVAPDVSHNAKLKKLHLGHNQLTAPPDLRHNVNLEHLDLTGNQISEAPDLTNNPNLQYLNMALNQLSDPPDVSHNVKLTWIALGHNQLTRAPDVTNNVELQVLSLYQNRLSDSPDISRNVNLVEVYLEENQITVAPDISNNINLLRLHLQENKLSESIKQQLRELAEHSRFLRVYL